jgi:hypothetical protein
MYADPDGRLCVLVDEDTKVRVLDAVSRATIGDFDLPAQKKIGGVPPILTTSYMPRLYWRSGLILHDGQKFQLVALPRGEPLGALHPSLPIAFLTEGLCDLSPDGSTFIVVAGTPHVWRRKLGVAYPLPNFKGNERPSLSRDGRYVTAVDDHGRTRPAWMVRAAGWLGIRLAERSPVSRIFDILQEKEVAVLPPRAYFAPDGRTIVVHDTQDRTVRLYDLPLRRPLFTILLCGVLAWTGIRGLSWIWRAWAAWRAKQGQVKTDGRPALLSDASGHP